MPILTTSFLRHLLPQLALWVLSDQNQAIVASAATAGVAYIWSYLEKKAKKHL